MHTAIKLHHDLNKVSPQKIQRVNTVLIDNKKTLFSKTNWYQAQTESVL